jgi:hypothetical protein
MNNRRKGPHECNNPECSWSNTRSVHGIEIEFDGGSFLFKHNGKVSGPYYNIYKLEPKELAEKLGIDCEKASFARFTALQMYEDRELGVEDLIDALGVTVRRDNTNKIVTFLVMLSAFTGDDQLNLSFRAESSTGKSYIPLEVSALFPEDRVIKIAYSSPTAFFHDKGVIDGETGEVIIDLEKKILIFLDQPHDQLLERLRPLLSHDQRELRYKITDKREKSGLRTKNVLIKGFPAVVFCTGRLRVDDQEATRMILLSPEISQEKFREAIYLKVLREANERAFIEYVEANPRRKALKERVRRISELNVKEIIVPEPEKVFERFIRGRRVLKPRHSRDMGRVMALIKVLALLNYNHRRIEENSNGLAIYASENDIDQALKIWNEISEAQEYGLSPFVLQVYKQVIEPLALEKSPTDVVQGATRVEIAKRFLEVFGRPLSRTTWEKEIAPSLKAAGLIEEEPHPQDRRKIVYIPTTVKKLTEDATPQSHDTFLQQTTLRENVSQQCGVTSGRYESLEVKNLKKDYKPRRNIAFDNETSPRPILGSQLSILDFLENGGDRSNRRIVGDV